MKVFYGPRNDDFWLIVDSFSLQEFLQSLDPPMHINRNDLKRWHPNFMVDHVPDIVPRELPQPPNSERPATAKEVLGRSELFVVI